MKHPNRPNKTNNKLKNLEEKSNGSFRAADPSSQTEDIQPKRNLFCPKSTWNSFCVEVLKTSILAYSPPQQSGLGPGAEEGLLPRASAAFLVFSPFFQIDFPFCRPSFWAKVGIAVKTELITMTTTNTHTRTRLAFFSDMDKHAAAGSTCRSTWATPHGAPASMEERKKRRGGRSYRCDAPPPRCRPEEWSRGRARTPPPTLLLRNGNGSDGSVQPSATTTRLLPVVKKKSRDAATMAAWE